MRRPPRSARGFTLIELVITIAVGSVVVAFMALFIVMPMNAYTAQTRRAALVDASDSALRFMARDLRSSLPNSVRITSSGTVTALELLATADGARYQDGGPLSNPALALDFAAPAGAFATTVPFTRLTLPWSSNALLSVDLQRRRTGRQCLSDGERHHAGRHRHHDLRRRGGQPESGHAQPRISVRVRLSGEARLPGERAGILPVRYLRRDPDPLLRLHDREHPAASAATLAAAGATAALVAADVGACQFTYPPGTASRNALATLDA